MSSISALDNLLQKAGFQPFPAPQQPQQPMPQQGMPPQGAPMPMDPAMAQGQPPMPGAPPAQGQMPPAGAPVDPAMAGVAPMDPTMGGGAPPQPGIGLPPELEQVLTGIIQVQENTTQLVGGLKQENEGFIRAFEQLNQKLKDLSSQVVRLEAALMQPVGFGQGAPPQGI